MSYRSFHRPIDGTLKTRKTAGPLPEYCSSTLLLCMYQQTAVSVIGKSLSISVRR